jgi:branched-chain amino acid transport system substrate-binding protein
MKIDSPFQFLLIGPSLSFFPQKFGKNLEGMVSIGHWSPSAKWTGAKAFNDAYVARWKETPDNLDTVIAYVSCQILEAAVKKGGLDKEKIREAIATDTFDTIMGPVKFANNNNATTKAGLLQVQNGVNQIIWPPEIATAKYIKKPAWQ